MAHPLQHRDFRWLVTGRAIDGVGNAIAPIALGFGVLDLFGSVASLGLVVGAASLGNVLLYLVGGVVADRLPRTLVLIASNLTAGAVQLTVALLILGDVQALWLLAALGFAGGAAGAFDYPAVSALVPQTVPSAALERANGALRLAGNGTALLGAAIAGALVATVGPGPALLIDAASFVVATACYARVRVPSVPRETHTSPFADLADGWREFSSRTWVWVVVVAFFFVNAAWGGGFNVLGLAIADDTFGRAAWGIVVGAEAAGAITGALLAGRWRFRRPMAAGMLFTTALAGPLFALALVPSVLVLVPIGFVAGVCIVQFSVVWDSALQRHVPEDKLARVYSFDAIGSFAAIPIGQMAVGPLAAAHGVRPVLLATGAVVVVASAGALLSRSVRDLPGAATSEPAPHPA